MVGMTQSGALELGLIIVGIVILVWFGLVLNHRFAGPGRKSEIDAERRRRNIGIIAGHSGASGAVSHPGQVAEELRHGPE